jgi:tRNA U34 5-methylaminomethyl-2-thiouridine-forming methyltransferase MnmC
MNNIHNVEKTMQKYQQLAKDAQSNGDPVLAQNYLQHADHYLRRYNELNERRENSIEKTTSEDKSPHKDNVDISEKETQTSTN